MTTTNPVTTATEIALAQPAASTPVKQEDAKLATAKKPAIKKPTIKKAAESKPAAKKTIVVKVSDTQAAVKKPAVKTPLSKASASDKMEKAAGTTKSTKPITTAKAVKLEKVRKPKLVRDSFTIPKVEYIVLEALKQRATRLTHSVKKSELLRAGIKALAALSDAAFLKALAQVPAIKTGRPASEK